MKVLVTGPDGLLGSNLVSVLLEKGYETRALVQYGRNTDTLDGLGVEIVRGDMLDRDSLISAVGGCRAVIHAAANTSTSPARSASVREVNIEGTRNILHAVRKSDIERFIHVGTTNSFGFGSKDDPGDETRPYTAGKYNLDYFNAKYEAQKLVLREVEKNRLPAVIVNPTFLVGPYDSKPGFGTVIIALYHGKLKAIPIGGRNYIHVRDVAMGIVNALTMGRIGECYILGNRNLSYEEIFTMITRVLNVSPPKRVVSPFAAKLYGICCQVAGNITGKSSGINLAIARIACDEHYYSAQKAIDELALPQTPIEHAIEEAFHWLEENGYLEKETLNTHR
jgi:dihydroflavonol-4-reductase